jgi:hypothetical protein
LRRAHHHARLNLLICPTATQLRNANRHRACIENRLYQANRNVSMADMPVTAGASIGATFGDVAHLSKISSPGLIGLKLPAALLIYRKVYIFLHE